MSLPSGGIGHPKFKGISGGLSTGGGIAKRAWGGPMIGGVGAPISPTMPGMMARGFAQEPLGNFRQDMMPDTGQGRMFQGPQYRPFAEGGTVSEPEKSGSAFLHGETAGRADKIITKSPNGSYIIPADIVSHLGEGNSEAGGKVITAMLARMERERPNKLAVGGSTNAAPIPVALSHGEFQVSPRHVAMIGHGSLKHGHAVLDKWVQKVREDHIKTLKKLKPPIGAKKAA